MFGHRYHIRFRAPCFHRDRLCRSAIGQPTSRPDPEGARSPADDSRVHTFYSQLFVLAPNETQDERRRTRARVARSESAEVISKVERTAVRRSLHRMVRSLWVYWRPWRNDLSAAP